MHEEGIKGVGVLVSHAYPLFTIHLYTHLSAYRKCIAAQVQQ